MGPILISCLARCPEVRYYTSVSLGAAVGTKAPQEECATKAVLGRQREVEGRPTLAGSCLLFFSALLQNLTDYAFRFTYYSWKLPRLQVASLASWWYMHFLLKSGGFGVSSRLVIGVFFHRLRQLPIAKYSYAESNPPFLSLNCCTSLVLRP